MCRKPLMPERALEYVWESATFSARLARGALVPASWLYAGAVAARNLAYDQGWFRAKTLALPAVAIGNLTVGGTGKTPVAAFIASTLAARGARPALVLRGYGGDETLVHARLNPAVPVLSGANRVASVERARALGATVAVLDDGFQHRRAARDADIVLLSADLAGPVRPLPAGPWREPLSSLARASLIVVTRKNASPLRARELLAHARRYAPGAGGAVIHLAADAIVSWSSGEARDPRTLNGARVLAAAAIGNPRAFAAQLAMFGARIALAAERDHHAFSADDAAVLAHRAEGFDYVVCTLKDAVKLGPLWPREAPPLWYLSQRVEVESGADQLERILAPLATKI
jgi:tetraacyldisaccharide 4'-kinase